MRFRRCSCASLAAGLFALAAPAAWGGTDPAPGTIAPAPDAQTSGPDSPTTPEPMGAGPGGLMLAAGAAVWSGRFGFATRTTILSDSLDARLRAGPVRISGTVPYLSITSDAGIFTGIDGTPLVTAPNAASLGLRRQRNGLGDLTLGASVSAFSEAKDGLDLSLSTRVKLPTASNSQLSTGRTDAAFGAEASKTFGRVAPILSVSYRVFGDTPARRLHDGAAGSVGASYLVGGGTVVLLTYDFAERTSDYIGPSNQIVLGASRPVGQRLRLTGYASAGLSSGAAAVAGGVSLGYRFGRR